MNLRGSIRDIQNNLLQLYLELENRFRENSLIRELWGAMAQDISEQVRGLNALPHLFWNQLKRETDSPLPEAIGSAIHQNFGDFEDEDKSLKGCFTRALRLEEPMTLRIYAPLIRRLRESSAEPSLDFYIMVKAHLARLTRATQAFAGDPVLIQRANSLLESFEKEVQTPQITLKIEKKRATIAHPGKAKEAPKKTLKAPGISRSLTKQSGGRHRRPKPLLKKVSIARRRARS